MNFYTIMLSVFSIIFFGSHCDLSHDRNLSSTEVKILSSHKKVVDTTKKTEQNVSLLIKGIENYDILISKIQKKEFEKAVVAVKRKPIIDRTIIPSQVKLTTDCYTLETTSETIEQCISADEQLLSLSYSGFIKKMNSCVFTEYWFESTTLHKFINLENGSTYDISGDEVIFSKDLKFIYSYANDGIDFSGIALHQVINKKISPIVITNHELEEKYNFDFSGFGRAYWTSNTSFCTTKGDKYYKFNIQDKRITYRNEHR